MTPTRSREPEPTKTSLEREFAALCQIVRAQHFAWRRAVAERCPAVDPAEIVAHMWRITGEETARAYIKRIDATKPLAPQVAENIAWSSRCMGEDAVAEVSEGDEQAFVRHRACPWKNWHERHDLLAEDRPACDAWFDATLDGINRALRAHLRFETLETLPEGGSSCLRRLWVEAEM
jgi:hypothetical protein